LLKWIRASSILFFIIIGLSYYFLPPFKQFINEASSNMLQGDIHSFKTYLLSFGIWAPIISSFLMVFSIVVVPFIPTFIITFANGLLFGLVWGTLFSWFSGMLGAAIAFWVARSMGEPVLKKFINPKLLDRTNQYIERYGTYSIFITRFVPIFSFALISYGAGLTSMGFIKYMIATGIGQAPITIIYTYLGEQATGSIIYIFWAFVIVILIGMIGVIFKSKLKMF